MRRIERQFLSMAVVILVVAATVTSINTMTFYRTDKFVHGAEMYFHCLQVNKLRDILSLMVPLWFMFHFTFPNLAPNPLPPSHPLPLTVFPVSFLE